MLDIDIRGEGEDVILLHGAPLPTASVAPLRDFLVEHYRVAVPDLAGIGLPPQEALQALESSLEAAGFESASVIGHSFGTFRGFQLALGDTIDVERLAALAPIAFYPDEIRRQHLQVADALDSGAIGKMQLAASLAPQWFSEGYRDADAPTTERIVEWFESFSREDLVATLRVEFDIPDITARLSGIDVPVYLRVGGRDHATPPEWARQIAAKLPNAQLDVVGDAGHFLQYEDLPATLGSVVGFLQRA